MKAKLLFLIFILAASAWCLIVITFATTRGVSIDFPFFIANPWAGIALGTFGGFMIGALGLRMYANVTHKEYLRKLATIRPLATVNGTDPLVPCQTMYREPYFSNKAVV